MVKKTFTHEEAKAFYYRVKDNFTRTPEWRYLRRCALLIYGNECHQCYEQGSRKKSLHVDHILPKSMYPHLSMDITNLQVLCEECNTQKNNIIFEDYRPEKHRRDAILYKQNRKTIKQIISERKTKSELIVGKNNTETKNPVDQLQQNNINIIKKKATKNKKRKKILDIQVKFLEDIRNSVKQNKQWEVLKYYNETIGTEATKKFVARCNVGHWFR